MCVSSRPICCYTHLKSLVDMYYDYYADMKFIIIDVPIAKQ